MVVLCLTSMVVIQYVVLEEPSVKLSRLLIFDCAGIERISIPRPLVCSGISLPSEPIAVHPNLIHYRVLYEISSVIKVHHSTQIQAI